MPTHALNRLNCALGFEIHAGPEECKQILDQLLRAEPDMAFAGSEAMNSMSMERGFVHWHGDVDYTDKVGG